MRLKARNRMTAVRSRAPETNIQIVWPGKERAPLRPRRLASAVVERFGAEMKPLSPACAGR